MKDYSNAVLAIALLVLTACGGSESEMAATEAVEAERMPWAEFAAITVDEYYSSNPEYGVDAGLHQYDGLASDYSLEGLDEYTAWLDSVIVDASVYDDLGGIEGFERDYLVQALKGELWYLRLSDPHSVRNYGLTERIHLSIDVVVNEWVESAILEGEEKG